MKMKKKDLETLSRGGRPYEEFISEFPSVLTTLQKFSSVKIPFAELLRILSPLDVRYYSIASSQKMYPSQIHVCVSVVTYYYSGVKHNGVCSNYLARAQSSQKVRVFVVSAPDFHLSGKQPIILVGPGTGIAPFRGFWQGNDIKRRIYLYFGCRHEDDELYKNEIMEAIAANKLNGYDVAFSRKNIEEKVYVQHKLVIDGEKVYQILTKQKGILYICGDAKMANDVMESLGKIAVIYGKCSPLRAINFVKALNDEQRIRKDTYGLTLNVEKTRRQQTILTAASPSATLNRRKLLHLFSEQIEKKK